jgi:hypothetical protein
VSDAVWIGLPTVGFALLGGTALWVSVNHNHSNRVSWLASVSLFGMLLIIVLAASRLIG